MKETIAPYFLALEAHRLNEIARKHWAIENQLHWPLDVVFKPVLEMIKSLCVGPA